VSAVPASVDGFTTLSRWIHDPIFNLQMSILVLLSMAICSCESLKIFMCVTGQLSRLEVMTKIQFVVKPNHRAGALIDVGFVLDVHSNYSTNLGVELFKPDQAALVAHFQNSGANVVFFDARNQTEDPFISPTYVQRLDNTFRSIEFQRRRAANHFRQFEAISRCNSQVAVADYDVYVRLRDDALFVANMNLTQPWLPGIHVPRCNAWTGINDRGAIIVGRAHADAYFRLLFHHFVNFDAIPPEGRSTIRNPESFLAYVMRAGNVPIHIDCNFSMPFVSSRREKGSPCVTNIDLGEVSHSSPYENCENRPLGPGVRCIATDLPRCKQQKM